VISFSGLPENRSAERTRADSRASEDLCGVVRVRRTGIGPEQKTTTLVLKDHRGLRLALFSGRGWIVVYEGRRHEVLELRISRNRFLAVCFATDEIRNALTCFTPLKKKPGTKIPPFACATPPNSSPFVAIYYRTHRYVALLHSRASKLGSNSNQT
jgi:hypothetical protein